MKVFSRASNEPVVTEAPAAEPEAPVAEPTEARDVIDGQGDDLECVGNLVERDGVGEVDGDVVARDSSDQTHDGA